MSTRGLAGVSHLKVSLWWPGTALLSQILEMGLLAAEEIKVPPRLCHASPEADTSLAHSARDINKMGHQQKQVLFGHRTVSVPCSHGPMLLRTLGAHTWTSRGV